MIDGHGVKNFRKILVIPAKYGSLAARKSFTAPEMQVT